MSSSGQPHARLQSTPAPMRRWRGAGGVTLAGDEWGRSDDPLVILLHGAGQTRHAWRNAGRKLGEAGYRAVALDARGHGDSDWAPDGDYSTESLVEDLISVVSALGRSRPVLVGASMGGGTSLVAVGEGHLDARALVLVDVAPRMRSTGIEAIKSFMDGRPEGFASLEEVADAIATYRSHDSRPANLASLAKNVRLGPDGRYHWHWDPRLRSRRLVDAESRTERLEACAARLSLPTLLVRGGLSDVLTAESARAFLELCPHAEYVRVDGAAHMIAGDRNDAFSAAVIEFLQRVVPTARG